MKITTLQTDHEDDFKEAVSDLDWHRIACRIDDGDAIELMRYLRQHFFPVAEAVEDEIEAQKHRPSDEKIDRYLDNRDRARDMNDTLKRIA